MPSNTASVTYESDPLQSATLISVRGDSFCLVSCLFFEEKGAFSLIQLLGAGFLVMVVLTHFCEALSLFPSMHWGSPHSVGHYLDLGSAVLGLILFPAGLLLRLHKRAAR